MVFVLFDHLLYIIFSPFLVFANNFNVIVTDTQIENSEYIKIRKLSFEKQNPGEQISDEVEQELEREVRFRTRCLT